MIHKLTCPQLILGFGVLLFLTLYRGKNINNLLQTPKIIKLSNFTYFVFVWNCILFDMFSPIIHAKMTEIIDENGDIQISSFKSGDF